MRTSPSNWLKMLTTSEIEHLRDIAKEWGDETPQTFERSRRFQSALARQWDVDLLMLCDECNVIDQKLGVYQALDAVRNKRWGSS